MAKIKRHSAWLLLSAFMLTLPACASGELSTRAPELIVEGNEESYPLFEAAAKACNYSEFWLFPGVELSNAVKAPPHFNLFGTSTRAAKCATGWVYDNPETGLHVSYH